MLHLYQLATTLPWIDAGIQRISYTIDLALFTDACRDLLQHLHDHLKN